MKHFLRVAVVAAGFAVLEICQAQGKFPGRPIMIVSPYQAGGTTEVFARVLTDDMAASLGQPILIEQKPGAGGTIGAQIVATSKPDGYTLLANTSQHVMYEGMFKKLSFDPMKDFQPVGIFGSTPIIVVVAAGSPLQSFAEALSVAQSKELTFASGSLGSLPHLTGELVAQRAKVKMTHVAYNGTAPALTDVMGGHVDMLFSPAASAEPLIRSGKLRALAVSSKERMASLPNVPTFAESGMKDFAVTAWYGLWAPKDTPREIVKQLNGTMREVASRPSVKKRMEELSITANLQSPEEVAAFEEQESHLWLEVMRNARLEPN